MDEFIKILASRDNSADGDYIQDDLLYCGKCHTPKQALMAYRGDVIKLPIMCKCRKKEFEEQEKREQREKRLEVLKKGIPPGVEKCTFAADDGESPNLTRFAKNYVKNWDRNFRENIGIMFSGNAGTGKSYISYCIANELIENLVSVKVISTTQILNVLQGYDTDKEYEIKKIVSPDLLVIDDFGAQRGTPTATEQIGAVIEARALKNKPLIITTNLSLGELENAPTIAEKRIYDRILGMCPLQIQVNGKSRRIEKAQEKKKIYMEVIND